MTTQDKKNKTLLYIIILILFFVNIGLFYMWQTGKKDRVVLLEDKTALQNTVRDRNATIAAAEALLEQYQQDSAEMAANNIKMSDEMARKSSEIARLTYLLKKEKYASQDMIDALNGKLSDLNNQLLALKEENMRLRDNNDSLLSVNQDLYGENTKLSVEGTRLKNLAARLSASEIKVEPIRTQFLTGKETTTVKASRVKGFKINFSVAENNIAEPGDRDVYVKVTGPEGLTLNNEGQGGVVALADGKSAKYSYKTNIIFENNTLESPDIVWEPNKKLTPGKYVVQLFTEGYLMGSAGITLR